MIWRSRGATSSLCALAAILAIPMLTSGSGEVVTATVETREPRPEPLRDPIDDLAEAMAARDQARAAATAESDGPDLPAPELLESLSRKAEIAVTSPKGTRVWTVSALSDHDLPLAAKQAYVRAAGLARRTDPSCGLSWTLLAAIGRVESDHGRYAGAVLGADGFSRPRIIGVALNGIGPVAAIRDSDGGLLDRDAVWDRAVGPMQFIPSTWELAARDGDGDGRRSPHDLDDAAAAAASYLCSGSGDLRDSGAREAAIYRYNQSDYYVALVQAFEAGYRTGSFSVPAPSADAGAETRPRRARDDDAAVKDRVGDRERSRTQDRTKRPTTRQAKKPASSKETDAPAPAAPPAEPPPKTPKPAPKPGPAPDQGTPVPTETTALFTACDAGYCLGGQSLDLGVVARLAEAAAGDFDGDGAVETNHEEVTGMLDTKVTMMVAPVASGALGIWSINDVPLA